MADMEVVAAAPAEAEADAMEPVVSDLKLPIMQTVKLAQVQNGLRHDDYQRYRQYCTRRLRRVRKTVKFLHGKKEFKKKRLEAKHIKDERYLGIPLMNAERAWAYAMQLKGEMTQDTPRKRYHLVRRLKLAAKWSGELRELCSVVADPRTQLEAEAYSSWMHGNVLLEQDKHKAALELFLRSKNVYEELGKIMDASDRALCEDKVASIEPSVRYCKYILQRQGGGGDADNEMVRDLGAGVDTILKSKLAHVMDETRKKQAQNMDSVQWQNENLAIVNDKVRTSLILAEEVADELGKAILAQSEGKASMQDVDDTHGEDEDNKIINLFQSVFSSYDDAISVVRDDIGAGKTQKLKSATLEHDIKVLRGLLDFLAYSKLKFTVERNLYMVRRMSAEYKRQSAQGDDVVVLKGGKQVKRVKPDELVVLMERLVQTMSQRIELDKAGDQSAARAQILAVKAFRWFYLGESFKRLNKWNASTAVYQKCSNTVEQAVSAVNGAAQRAKHDKPLVNPINPSALEELTSEADAKQCVVRALASLAMDADTVAVKEKLQSVSIEDKKAAAARVKFLIDRLDQYDAGSPSRCHDLVSFPPQYQAAPCKPILFDLALNHVDYPDISERFTAEGTGVSGFIGGALGGLKRGFWG